MNRDARTSAPLVGTGIEGLDAVLGGGLTADRVYLLEGVPGAGKTTIALQFLMEGLRQGETVLDAPAASLTLADLDTLYLP